MDPINPWIDLGETRRLAERLMSPSREPTGVAEHADQGDGFADGSDAAGQTGFADPRLPAAGHAAAPGGSATTRERDWNGLRDRIQSRLSPLAQFLIDPSGTCVFSTRGFDAFHFVLRDLAAANDGCGRNRRLKIGARAMLEIIPVHTDSGVHWLGVVLPRALTQQESAQLGELWTL